MKVKFLGVSRRYGKGKTSGNDYDICEVGYVREIKPKRTENYVFEGYGFTENTIPCQPSAMKCFEGMKLGTEVDLKMEPQPENPRLSWVVGIS